MTMRVHSDQIRGHRTTHIKVTDLDRGTVVAVLGRETGLRVVDICRWRDHTFFLLEGALHDPWMRSNDETIEVVLPAAPDAEELMARLSAIVAWAETEWFWGARERAAIKALARGDDLDQIR